MHWQKTIVTRASGARPRRPPHLRRNVRRSPMPPNNATVPASAHSCRRALT